MDLSKIRMRTGISNTINDENTDINDVINNVNILMNIFMEDAIKMAFYYSNHSNRKFIHKEDTILALKTRAFYGDKFWNRENIPQKIEEMKKLLDNEKIMDEEEHEEHEEYEEYEEYEEEREEWTASSCKCNICNTLNNINNSWNIWNPTEISNIILKNAINNTLN